MADLKICGYKRVLPILLIVAFIVPFSLFAQNIFSPSSTPCTFNRNLQFGSRGEDVRNLQKLLNKDARTRVAVIGAGSPGNETSMFGYATQAVVIKFQNLYKQEVLTPVGLSTGNGFVGSLTRAKLTALCTGIALQSQPTTNSSSAQLACIPFTQTLRLGSTGQQVLRLQKMLNSNSQTQVAITGAGSPGQETAYFGSATQIAVVKFQNLYKQEILTPLGLLVGTGVVGPSTRAKFNDICLKKQLIQPQPTATSVATSTATATTTLPKAPDGISVSSSYNRVNLSWNVVPEVVAYNVKRKQESQDYVTIASNIKTNFYSDTQATWNGNTYYYVITSINNIGGESTPSIAVSAYLSGGGGGSSSSSSSNLSIPDLTVNFGRLSPSGAPVVTVASTTAPTLCSISSGNSSSYFAIDNSCNLTLAAGGVGNITDTYNLSINVTNATSTGTAAVTITTVANRYDVGTNAQFTTVVSNSAATLSGKTIALHPGNYTALSISKSGLSSTLTLVNAETNKPVIDTMTITGTSNLTLDGLKVRMTAWPSTTDVIRLIGNIANLTIKNSEIWHGYGSGNVEIDPTATYSEYSDASASMSDKLAYAISRDGSGTVSNITFQDNLLHDLSNGFKVGVDSGYVRVIGNTMDRIYQDFVSMGGANTPLSETTISWNIFSRPFSKSTDADNPHSDCIQLTGNDLISPYSQADWSGINIYGNIFFNGNARGGCQMVFMDDMPVGTESGSPTPRYFVANVTGNVLLSQSTGHGITIQEAKDSYIFGNTVVRADPASLENATPQAISIGGVSGSSEHFVGGNIVESIGTGSNIVDSSTVTNVVTGLNGATISYATIFDGPSFNPQSSIEVLSKYDPKTGGPAASGVKGSVGNNYVDFVNRIIDRTLEPSFVYFSATTSQPLSTVVSSNISKIRGGIDGRTVSISGSGSPEFRICSDATCSSVVRDWGTTSTTANVGQYAQVRLASSASGSQTISATLTIGGISYGFSVTTSSSASFTTVAFDGTTPDYLRNSGSINVSSAVVTATISGGVVTGGTITNGGTFYDPGIQQTFTFSGGSGSGATGYATDSNNDGILDNVTITAGGSGYTTAPTIAVARNVQRIIFAVRDRPGATTALDRLLSSSGSAITFSTLSSNKVRLEIGSSGANGKIDTSTGFSGSSMQTLICSIDFNQTYVNGFKCYLDGISIAPASPTSWTQGSSVNVGVSSWAIAANSTGTGNYWEGDRDFIYFAYGLAALDSSTGNLLDISDSTVRNRFTADNIATTTGSGPTGRQPQIFFTGDAATWNAGTNRGTGGNFTVTGAVQ